ncbi:MAG: 50S ribosomal protein L10 [Actinomycetota bacterium]|nr:50S ribosomal protein L10 [Actinomycetota bacterium]
MVSTREAQPRQDKVEMVSEVRTRIDSSDGVLLTEYRGLTVSQMSVLRRALREVGGEYRVYKNTLVRFAVRDLGLSDVEPLLVGPTALAFAKGDVAQVAKVLRDYARANPALVVKGGMLSGGVLSAGEAAALAELPSRDAMLSRFAGALMAPIQRMAGLLQALPQNFAYGLSALIGMGGDRAADGTTGLPGAEGSAPEGSDSAGADGSAPEGAPEL